MMKRIVTILLLVLISQNLWAGDNEEFRATWVITWELIDAGKSAEQNKALTRQILDNHQRANMNALLWQCRQSGTAYYNSSYEPWGYYAGYANPGYDPLAYAVEEAHKRGMELHAWFNVFQASSTQQGAPAAEHPEWICRDRDGNPMTSSICLSPGLAAVRDYTIEVAMEIVRKYDIDGLHLDYVRWNEYSSPMLISSLKKPGADESKLDGMITEEEIQALKTNSGSRYLYDVEHPYNAGVPQGFSSWEEWWRWCVTEFVRVLRDSIQAVKPWVRLSAAALGKYNWSDWQGYGTVYQDAALWFNKGFIDQLAPMHYHWLSGSEFYSMLESGGAQSWKPWIQEGIAVGRLFSAGPGSYKFAENKVWDRHPSVVETIRTIPWVDGFQFFSYGSWEDYQYWAEAGATFFNRKTKIRATKLIMNTTPDAPTIQISKLDSLNYQITVTPPVSVVTDHRYAIYRSPDVDFNLNSDEIVDIHFGKDSFTFTDHFSGIQDYNGIYNYAATTLDRYWNESNISNVVQTHPIPSFPPTIVATSPAAGDTVPVNTPLIFYFSKTMATSSVETAISITPTMAIKQFIWQDGNKTIKIITSTNLQYATSYTITINPLAEDINGKSIDGNNDGAAGDPFFLHFRTDAVDNMGPTVIFTHPDYQIQADSVDVEDVFTIIFDELINPKTIYDSTIVLRQKDQKIKIDYVRSVVSDRSVIDLKPFESLLPETDCSLLLRNTITDTVGNPMASDLLINFKTSSERYIEKKMIDDFLTSGYWQQPNYSGSTSGIVASNTTVDLTRNFYLPASWTTGLNKRCAVLTYQWLETPPPEGYLLREYLSTGPPRDVIFDTSYTLQCYVYGDCSNNKFRFCVDEGDGTNWPAHEVSQWITIDWYGWRLLEWKLNDPNSVGTWIGNGVLDGKAYRIDSFQLTHDNTGTISGKIYFDNLRIVKKTSEPVKVHDETPPMVSTFRLMQNYPNPFNPTTTIPFDLPKRGKVVLKVYDILGRAVTSLINEIMEPGHYEVQFDGSNLASGIYFYRIEFNGQAMSRQMSLLK